MEKPAALPWSDYLVFVDESGDHGLETIDPQYPVFVLLFCVIEKGAYADHITRQLQALKMEFFGRDTVVLHEYEIRKAYGPFSILQNQAVREAFMARVDALMTDAPISLIAAVVDKVRLRDRYVTPANPYNLAMQFGLERVFHLLTAMGQAMKETFVICESRGRREDDELELEFRRVCDGGNYNKENFPFRVDFVAKANNSPGLQLADLAARPIGRHVLKPNQPNRAFDVIRAKLYSCRGRVDGWGRKVFP